MSRLTDACAALGEVIAGIDPAVVTGSDAGVAVEMLARTEKRCAGLRVLLAARAASCGVHKGRGYSNPATWLAETSGITTGEAKAALDTAGRLYSCDATRAAMLAGDLSVAQAAEITKTSVVAPGCEDDLLDLAGRGALGALRDEARRRRLNLADRDEAYRRQRRERYLRWWRDDDGMIRIAGAFTPDVGVG